MVLRRTAQKESGYSLKFDRLRLTSYGAMEQLRRYLELGEELYLFDPWLINFSIGALTQ